MQNNYTPAATNNAVSTNEKNITDKVLNKVLALRESRGLILPKNYSVENALKSAYLNLSQNGLLNTDQTSLANALLNMVVQGLNPSKNQCYFINYGGKVNLMRSYHGDRAACIMSGLITDLQAYVIYKGDEVTIKDVDGYRMVEVKTNWENMNNEIVGAYAFVVLPDGRKVYDIMTIDRIKKSWSMSKNQSNNKLQKDYSDDACLRTITRHLVKNIFNQSIDTNATVDSYCSTTKDEYDNEQVIDAKSASEVVENRQEKEMASVKVEVEATGEVVDAPSEDFNYGI